MKIFFDTEFTGLHQATRLISIGMVDEKNRTFYAEFCDFMPGFVNEGVKGWAKKHILPHLKFYGDHSKKGFNNASFSEEKTEVFGETTFIKNAIIDWLDRDDGDLHEFWSDCLAYDWVLFNQLFGHAFMLPSSIYYIPFDICTLFKLCDIDPDINREEFAGMTNGAMKHNSLWDAKVIKACYAKLICSGYFLTNE